MHSSFLALALGVSLAKAQSFCDADLGGLCLQEKSTLAGITYRLAIPVNPAEGFQTILQIEAPLSVGWAGFAWATSMTNGPLTMGWANGEEVTISGRKTEVYTYPEVDPAVTLTALAGSYANETHWKASILCEGCSQFTNPAGNEIVLDPAATAAPFAWASADTAPADPADPASTFGFHSETGYLTFNLAEAQAEGFEEAIIA